jgi:hypothetical protein
MNFEASTKNSGMLSGFKSCHLAPSHKAEAFTVFPFGRKLRGGLRSPGHAPDHETRTSLALRSITGRSSIAKNQFAHSDKA